MKGTISCSLIYSYRRQAHAMAPFPSNESWPSGNKVLPATYEIDLWIFDLREIGPEARRFDRKPCPENYIRPVVLPALYQGGRMVARVVSKEDHEATPS
jgi:hypothetical protein